MVAALKLTSSYKAPTMRLVRDEFPADEDSMKMERRVFPRRPTAVTVQGRRLDHSLTALRQPVLMLNVRDLSMGGLSATTETPLAPGERIAVSFPPEGLRLGWAARGRVLRCEPSVMGYRIAVEFEAVPHAA